MPIILGSFCGGGVFTKRQRRKYNAWLARISAAIFLFAIPFAFAPAIFAQAPKAPPAATAAAVEAATVPTLTPADKDVLANAAKWLTDASRGMEQSDLVRTAAEAKMREAQAILLASKYKVLASHKLDPDVYSVDPIQVKLPDGSAGVEWQIRVLPKAPDPARPVTPPGN